MSIHRPFQLSCSCGREYKVKLWDSINVTENKELKAKLLSGEVNQVQCPQCKKKSYIEKNLLYHDSDKKLWFHMLPQTDRPKWAELEEEYRKDLKDNDHIKKYHFRLVFGREELLEKIRIFDVNLNDRLIEIIKLKIINEDESLKTLTDLKLFFSRHMPEDEEMHFSLSITEKGLNQTLVVASHHYEDLKEAKATEPISSGMYVSIHKTRVLH